MGMSRKMIGIILAILTLFLSFPAQAAGKTALELTAEPGRVHYSFSVPDQQFLILKYSAPRESGQQVIYGENGVFSGTVELPCSPDGGRVKITVEDMKKHTKAEDRIQLPPSDGYAPPQGKSKGKVTGLTLTETPEGFAYDFSAPETDFICLAFETRQQKGSLYLFPEDENGHYRGELSLPLTYARTLIKVKLRSDKGSELAEGEVRKGYQAPKAPAQQPGRLTGVTVCIDPGHQENGKLVSEPIGPGLNGYTKGTGGSAQGKATLRREAIVTLEVGMVLRDELLRQGANVVMTRETQDVFHTNIERCEIARDGNADIMLRLHCDLVENPDKRGISIYAPLNSDYARQVAEPALYRQMGETLINAMKTAVGYELANRTGTVKLGDDFVGNNWAQMPCFLIEMGYMSNMQDDYLLSQPVYQQWLAEGMAQGVYEIAVLRGWIGAE